MWIRRILTVVKEIVLFTLLLLVLTTMIGGVFIIGVLNIPTNLWDSQGIYRYIGLFIMLMAPVFALARVIEWWIGAYRRFSVIFRDEDQ